MERDDLELEQRVWSRIAGGPADCPQTVGILRRQEESAAVLRHLAQRTGGERREQLLALRRRCMTQAAALRGMLELEGTPIPKAGSFLPENGTMRRALAQLYRHSCQNYREYLAMEGDFAPCCEVYARREQETMADLLAQLGESAAGERN